MTDQYMLRLPNGWRHVVKAQARASHRSMNAEIVSAIEAAMTAQGISLPSIASHEKDRQGGHPDGLEQS